MWSDDRKIFQKLFEFALTAHIHRVEADVGQFVRERFGEALDRAGDAGRLVVGKAALRKIGNGWCIAAAVVVENDDDALI